jgi:hypothetical protein
MLYEIASDYITKANYPSETDKLNKGIYELCWFYLLGSATPTETDILKEFFKIN